MALTEDQRKAAEKARLEKLLADLAAAQRSKKTGAPNSNQKLQEATDALIQFQTQTEFPGELAPIAQTAVMTAALVVADQALDNLAVIASGLTPYGEAFREARETAKQGEKNLFLPRLAAASAQMFEVFTALKEAADTVAEQFAAAGQADNLTDINNAIEAVLAALQTVREKVDAVSES